jgi:hypothetical protein
MTLLFRIIRERPFLIGLYIRVIRNLGVINTVLFLLLAILLLLCLGKHLHITQNTFVGFFHNNLEYASKIASILGSIFNIFAISLAGIWAYYLFIKGRTFTPKIKVDIFLQHWGRTGVAIVRTKIVNSGKVRIRPLYAKLKAYSAKMESGEIEYVFFKEIENILMHHIEERNETLYLEPQDEVSVDIDIPVSGLVSDYGSVNSHQILVKVYFVDSKYHVWKHYTILALTD